jgi:nucleotide-binding universal stress UspA family protein
MATTKLFRRILVPHDFSAPASHALAVAGDLAAAYGGRITVLHVLTPFYSVPGYPTQAAIAWTPPTEMAAERRARLEQLVRKLLGSRARGVTCKAVVGEAVPAILAEARAADTIVMATHGRTGVVRLLIGSIAERVVRLSPIPVLTVRPPTRTGKRTPRAPAR